MNEADIARGVNVLQMLIPEDRERAAVDIRRVMDGESRPGTEYTPLRKDGSRFPAIVHANRIIRDGQPAGLRGILVDISMRKRAEAEIALRAALLDAATDMVIVHDLEGNIVYVNEAACRTHGYEREQMQCTNVEHVAGARTA